MRKRRFPPNIAEVGYRLLIPKKVPRVGKLRMVSRLLVVLVLTACAVVCSYHQGDMVSMVKRTQHDLWRTQWSDVLRVQKPRFGVDSTVSLKPVFEANQGYSSEKPLKL
jgi:hypothetical protein